jgi:MFS family permease
MNTNEKPPETKDRKVILSTLWIFVIFNYLYVDVAMVSFHPEVYQRAAARMTEGLVLGASVLMEIPIAMILLSRVLKYRTNRWANIIAGVVSTAFAAFPLFTGKPPAFYLLFSIIEIACTLFIVWYAWTWPKPEAQNSE